MAGLQAGIVAAQPHLQAMGSPAPGDQHAEKPAWWAGGSEPKASLSSPAYKFIYPPPLPSPGIPGIAGMAGIRKMPIGEE